MNDKIKKGVDKELDADVFYNYWIHITKQMFYSIGLLAIVVTMAFVLSGCSLNNNIKELPELPDKPLSLHGWCCVPDADYPNSCDGTLLCEEG